MNSNIFRFNIVISLTHATYIHVRVFILPTVNWICLHWTIFHSLFCFVKLEYKCIWLYNHMLISTHDKMSVRFFGKLAVVYYIEYKLWCFWPLPVLSRVPIVFPLYDQMVTITFKCTITISGIRNCIYSFCLFIIHPFLSQDKGRRIFAELPISIS